MSRVVILHGKYDEDEYFDSEPSASNNHWVPWLQKKLLQAGHDVQTPEIYRNFEANYATWRQEFERNIVDEPMILVGHSCGGGFLIRWLSEHPGVAVKKLVLVAPWLDPFDTVSTDFFNFDIDPRLGDRVGTIDLFHSTDDEDSIRVSAAKLLETLPTIVEYAFSDKGHFCFEDLGTNELPEILAAITEQSG